MNRKVIIAKVNGRIITAISENGTIRELKCVNESEKSPFQVGNIYVGKVKNIVGNINAAFVEIAKGVECYFDIAKNPHILFTNKIGKKPLCIGDELLVQIQKEAVKTKAMTVTSMLNITGKYAVLTYGDPTIGISNKITKEKKTALKDCFSGQGDETCGFIIRTNAQSVPVELVRAELDELKARFSALKEIADKRTCYSCLHAGEKAYIGELLHQNQEELTEILIEDPKIYEETRAFLESHSISLFQKLTHYTDTTLPLHKLYSLEHVIDLALKERVWLKSGAYLVIQPTEAMVVIDVNTGKAVSKKKDETFYHKVNLEAAVEIAKQIRLRNLSGIIVVDFINSKEGRQQKELLSTLDIKLREDPVLTTLIDVTKLQLVEITRRKVHKSFSESYYMTTK